MRLSVITWILVAVSVVGGSYTSAEMQSTYSTADWTDYGEFITSIYIK